MASSITLPDSRKLSYSFDESPPDGPTVLLSSPLCAPFTAWDHVVPILNRNGFRTLRYDPPGHGDSSAPDALDTTTFDSISDDVRLLLRSLNIAKLHSWVGVSMGAATGIVFTTKYPGVVSKLVICDTISSSPVNANVDDTFGPRVDAARAAGSMDSSVHGTLERWFGTEWLDANPQETQRMRDLMLRTSINGFETCCHALRSPSFDLRPLFAKIGASVDEAVCVVGEKDANPLHAMSVMRAKIAEGFAAAGKSNNVELVIIKNAGHVCFIDGLDQFSQIITSFLKA